MVLWRIREIPCAYLIRRTIQHRLLNQWLGFRIFEVQSNAMCHYISIYFRFVEQSSWYSAAKAYANYNQNTLRTSLGQRMIENINNDRQDLMTMLPRIEYKKANSEKRRKWYIV